jgi:hypothetical protein
MRTRFHKSIGIFVALLLIAQAAMPVSAIAEVTMRCGAMPAKAAPCARAVVPAQDVDSGRAYGKLMACCRAGMMAHGCPHCGSMQMPVTKRSLTGASSTAVLTNTPCMFTVHYLNTASLLTSQARQRWVYGAAASMAPPAVDSLRICPPVASSFLRPTQDDFLPVSPFVRSHGLRAPPVA